MKVKVGQIWVDYDIRFRQQRQTHKRIVKIKDNYAYCEGFYDQNPNDIISKTRIRLDRFKPNSNGYKFVKQESKEEK